MATRHIRIPGAELEVLDWGNGAPIVFIQTALTADELLPVAQQPALGAGYRKVVYHRRGYARSSPADGTGSIGRDAEDCRHLLAAMGIADAHVVGYSYSAAVALQLAVDAPEVVRTLVLIEPPPVHTANAGEFRSANDQLIRDRRERGPEAALDEFLLRVIGPSWRSAIEQQIPGAAAQMQQDAPTFFDIDLPALLAWEFGAADAQAVRCPVLYIGGSDSGPWFDSVRALLEDWLPAAEVVVLDGADHSLSVTHSLEIAEAVAAFLLRLSRTPPS